jgi:hypothetical protein
MVRSLAALTVGLMGLVVADRATAILTTQDHLHCYKLKDAAAKKLYTADLDSANPSFPSEQGCQIKLPGKMFCRAVAKHNVNPTPPGAPSGPQLFEDFVCYKLKCGKSALTVQVTDQFGSRSMTVKKPTVLCSPVNVD